MCGIAGIFRADANVTAEDIAATRLMLDAQTHRGPDDTGLYHDRHIVLGHRRLAIIDFSHAAHQPMSNQDGTVWVAHNGEIYNFQELRRDLIGRGRSFGSKSDSEVLLHGYQEWGIEDLIARLRGMFSFCIYDATSSQRPRLMIVRDRFGIKPLYYYQDGSRLIFASEVKALLRSGLVPRETNVESLVQFLQVGSVLTPQTTVKGVLSLPAAHYLFLDHQQKTLKRYWSLGPCLGRCRRTALPREDSIHRTRVLLEEAVRLHLISDVPLRVFLSGGIDSSSLVALASLLQERPLTTVSMVFDETESSEAGCGEIVARRYCADHRRVTVRREDFVDEMPHIFAAMDQPTVDGVNTYFVAKAAKKAGLTAVLSGLGGDEVFLGYDHFKKIKSFNKAWRFFARLPGHARGGIVRMAVQSALLTGNDPLGRLSYLDDGSEESVYLLFRGLFTSRQIQDLLGIDAMSLRPPVLMDQIPETHSLLDSVTLMEFRHYLQDQLLRDTDFMSMAHALETRVPYLDHLLVEYVLTLPASMKLSNEVNKPLLIGALGDDLPKEVWNRPKRGFLLPFHRWLKKEPWDIVAITLEQNLLNKKVVEDIWRGFWQGRIHWTRPWALTVLSEWHQRFLTVDGVT
jgi:asparagine synthase (glutamine-hydrolysing)